jgi:glycosyltransferase involved in cell wall biosynthesis
MITILHVITSLTRAGAETQLVNLIRHTTSDQLTHIVCYLHPPHDLAPELRNLGIETICLNLPRKWPWLFAPRKLVPLLRARRPDFIQTRLLDADLSARFSVILGPSIPIINTLHMPTYDRETIRGAGWPAYKMAVLKRLDRWTARATRPRFVAISESVKRSAVRNLGLSPADVPVIRNSIDQTTLHCDPEEPLSIRKEAGIAADAFVYLTVGRLAPQKGQSLLLRAFKQVAAAIPDAYLAIAGEGPLATALETLASELGIHDRVRFLGNRTDVGACLEMADAFVFPSLFEGLGNAAIEAMFKGLPCIVTRIEPNLELFVDSETALLATPGSESELASAMVNLYRDPNLRHRLGAAARAVAIERFDSREVMSIWAQFYREMAATCERASAKQRSRNR